MENEATEEEDEPRDNYDCNEVVSDEEEYEEEL